MPFPPTCSSLPGLSLPAFIVHSRIALFRNTRVCLQASGMLTFTPSMRQLPTTIYCVCHMLCAGQGTLCALFKRMQKPGFLRFYRKPVQDSKGEGTCPESYSWRAQRPAGSWCTHLYCKPQVPSLHPTTWLFYLIQHRARSQPLRLCFRNRYMLLELLVSGLIIFLR